MNRIVFALLLLGSFAYSWCFGAEIKLYTQSPAPHSQVENYDQLINSIRPGDDLVFDNGKSFKVVKYLNQGGVTKIFEIEGNRVIRLPLKSGATPFEGNPTYRSYLMSYFEGMSFLADTDASIVSVDFEASNPYEYIITEKLDVKFTLGEYRRGSIGRFTALGRNLSDYGFEAGEALDRFARGLWQLDSIKDLRADQIVFDGKDWKILDVTGASLIYSYDVKVTPMDHPKYADFHKSVIDRLVPTILRARAEAKAKGLPISTCPKKFSPKAD